MAFKLKRPLSKFFGKVGKTKVGDTKTKAVYHEWSRFNPETSKEKPQVRKTVVKTKGKRVVTKFDWKGNIVKKKVGGKRVI